MATCNTSVSYSNLDAEVGQHVMRKQPAISAISTVLSRQFTAPGSSTKTNSNM